ncbi:glycosyltransferase family 2 protein [Bradyrhizobium sp. NBAIM20]|uniref:glycosyltransferase family 2 protein n=1 Tax=unclassified Bradyrhizobium TaxID=2631580 RepID=UPI001CD47BB9|nr:MULTISPECIES: glycosyltransferase family 2 protein [unclassified Bradyrhizobium]MCA1414681.1 glycosyltransferase family 2 protein [Bradyrhizobium sp. NBAIM20]MCA1461870.1 glycosyltransferase family 2 protein [Bradyrhizobium sp. NBAIM18]
MFLESLRFLFGRVNKTDAIQFGLRGLLLPSRIRHLSGPAQVNSGPRDVTIISVVRNGEPWLESFLTHHRAIGVKHFVILDNGSTDCSISMLANQADVTLLSSSVPYHAYENTMKRYLANTYCRDRWCLCVDVDEQFDFPGSARLPLSALINYLDGRGFNAVITQMLDMFSDRSISEVKIQRGIDLRLQFPFYDVSTIDKSPYTFGAVSNPEIMTHHGGIRKKVFGTNNGLTKVSLFRMDGQIKPFVAWHHALNARLADISCVLLHFPFVDSFYAKVADAVRTGRYGYLTSDEYSSYWAGLQRLPGLCLKFDSASKLSTVDELLDNGFLATSKEYRNWLCKNTRVPA